MEHTGDAALRRQQPLSTNQRIQWPGRSPGLQIIALGTLLLLALAANAAGPLLPQGLADAPAISAALNNALEIAKTGSRTRWDSPGGRHGFITINRTWFPKPDQPCREYLRSQVNPGGKPALMHGTGCRDDNGKWMLLETRRGAVINDSDCPPAATLAAPRPPSPPRPVTHASRKPSASSSKTPAATARTSPAGATKRRHSARRAKPAAKTTATPTATPVAAAPDAAAAAIIGASQPTPAAW